MKKESLKDLASRWQAVLAESHNTERKCWYEYLFMFYCATFTEDSLIYYLKSSLSDLEKEVTQEKEEFAALVARIDKRLNDTEEV